VRMQFLLVPARPKSPEKSAKQNSFQGNAHRYFFFLVTLKYFPLRFFNFSFTLPISNSEDKVGAGDCIVPRFPGNKSKSTQWDGVICVPVTYSHRFDFDAKRATEENIKTQGNVSIGPLGIPDR
jgi:hypothetical protein